MHGKIRGETVENLLTPSGRSCSSNSVHIKSTKIITIHIRQIQHHLQNCEAPFLSPSGLAAHTLILWQMPAK